MILLVKSGGEQAMADWRACFAAIDPRLDIRWWDDPAVRPEEVAYTLVWDPEPGRLAQLPNLRVIFGSGAGVDFITRDPLLPKHIPLVRMASPEAAQRMGEYIAWACLSLLRDARRSALGQAQSRWDFFEVEACAPDRRVGIMGLGHMGARTAGMLRALGFPVAGWSRTPKQLDGVETFAGAQQFDAFLARTDILVCLLPATPETRHIISAALLAKLPRGAQLVNAGRGSHARLEDIIAALDSGHLAGAVLDVFEPEPLPAHSPAWTHPRIIITPHLASLPPRRERARHVADSIAKFERGEALPNTYDHARGY